MNTGRLLATLFIFSVLLSLYPNLKAQDDIVSNIHITLDIETKTRVQVEYPGIVEIVFTMANETIRLNTIKVLLGNDVIKEYTISKDLIGIDKQSYEEYTELKSAPEYAAMLGEERLAEIQSKIEKAKHSEKIWIDTQKIYGINYVAGSKKTINLIFEFDYKGQKMEITRDLTIEVLPPLPKPSIGIKKTTEGIKLAPVPVGEGWYYGDLHVHSTYTDCDWPANGMYYVYERRGQAMNAGLNWISVTDHGYCMSTSEWNSMKSETDSWTDNVFVIMPSEEFSVKEDTPSSSDEEPYCIFSTQCRGTGAHLGAHNLTNWIGNQAGTCTGGWPPGNWSTYRCPSNPGAQQGINQVNSNNENSFSIINHPSPEPHPLTGVVMWDWDSLNVSGETGIEVWNGDWDAGDQRAVNIWKSKLLRGEHIFAYGGTDAEPESIPSDGVFNAVYIEGNGGGAASLLPLPKQGDESFSRENLVNAIRAGHVYISNGPALVLYAQTSEDSGMMGDSLTASQMIDMRGTVKLNIVYDSGITSGIIILHKA